MILALIFIGIMAILVTVMGSLTITNLAATAGLKTTRSSDYSAEAATEAAIQVVRYQSFGAYPSPSSCAPTGWASNTVDQVTMAVYCQSVAAPSGYTRAVTLSSCPSTTGATACVASPVLKAQASFNDLSGAMQVTSWVLNR